jgi:hypothetical protein
VKITQLPVINGRRLTPAELLTVIRLNINSMIDTNVSEFSPYDDGDASTWPSDDPLGTEMHIDVYSCGLPVDDLTVVMSEHAADHWTFSTVWTLANLAHPVGGNRQFGITPDPDGGFTVYTQGADRAWRNLDAVSGPAVWAGQRALWLSLQQGVAAFVNNNGGSATVALPISTLYDWQQVRDRYFRPSRPRLK